MTGATTTTVRPIGFWLKLVDTLIDDHLADALRDHGLSRLDWQVLNVVRDGATDIAAIAGQLRPFLATGASDVAIVVDELRSRGWITVESRAVRFAPEREPGFASVQQLVASARRAAVEGIDPSEYLAVLSVLERMARNLGWPDASPTKAPTG